jgi:modulator of FtsH protease HflK
MQFSQRLLRRFFTIPRGPMGCILGQHGKDRGCGVTQGRDWLKKILEDQGLRNGRPRGVPPGGGSEIPSINPPSRRNLLTIAALIFGIWGLWSCFYTVQPEERAVIKRLGKVIGIADPGLHFRLPFGIDRTQFVATERVLKEEFGFRTEGRTRDGKTTFSEEDFTSESLMLTGDLNVIDVEWVVQYRIGDPIKYLYAMREPRRTLRDLSESVMRRVVGNRIGSEALTTGRVDIATTARNEIQSAMNRYDNGIQVITVELQNVVPPPRVQPAFNEVNEARQERERMINEATKQANQAIPRTEGEANRVVSEAEGYATERVNRALGESARFESVLAEYRVAPDVTRARLYLESLRQVLPKVGSVLVVQDGQVPPVPLLNLRDAQPKAKEAAK